MEDEYNISEDSNCKTCTDNNQIKNTQRFVLIGGGIFFFLGIYGLISLIMDIMSIF